MSLTIAIIVATSFIGLGIGYALQRGRGCTNTAFRNLLLFGNSELALMIVIIVCIEIIGYFFLSLGLLSGFRSNPLPFSYLLIPIGGFIFGLGTVFAGGCAGGTCYRVGEGSISSVLALIGFAGGIGIIAVGPLAQPVTDLRQSTLITKDNQSPALDQYLPRWIWTIFALIIVISTIYYYLQKQDKGETYLDHLSPKWTPINTGIIIGILGVAARYVSTISGRDFGLSTTDGIAQLVLFFVSFDPLEWAGVFIITLILGSAIASLRNSEFNLTVPKQSEIIRFFGGGLMLGIGAMLGLGCNFGHIFGGLPELGISSVVSVIFMMSGNWVGSSLFYQKFGNPLPKSTPVNVKS